MRRKNVNDDTPGSDPSPSISSASTRTICLSAASLVAAKRMIARAQSRIFLACHSVPSTLDMREPRTVDSQEASGDRMGLHTLSSDVLRRAIFRWLVRNGLHAVAESARSADDVISIAVMDGCERLLDLVLGLRGRLDQRQAHPCGHHTEPPQRVFQRRWIGLTRQCR